MKMIGILILCLLGAGLLTYVSVALYMVIKFRKAGFKKVEDIFEEKLLPIKEQLEIKGNKNKQHTILLYDLNRNTDGEIMTGKEEKLFNHFANIIIPYIEVNEETQEYELDIDAIPHIDMVDLMRACTNFRFDMFKDKENFSVFSDRTGAESLSDKSLEHCRYIIQEVFITVCTDAERASMALLEE